MLKITIFTTDESSTQLGIFEVAHITMFDKDMRTAFHFIKADEQLSFVTCCIKNYVLIEIQGTTVKLIPESRQRVNLRFDGITQKK